MTARDLTPGGEEGAEFFEAPLLAVRLATTPLAKEALDNRSPVEAVPYTNWEILALTGAAEGVSRVSQSQGWR